MHHLATLARLGQWAMVALAAYDAAIAAAAWRQPAPRSGRGSEQRFRVLIAAHDEEHVIGSVVRDIANQSHPAGNVRTVVIADRCSDRTSAAAAAAGAEVRERRGGLEGKGAVLAWYLTLEPLDPDEAVVVLDADTRVPPDVMAGFAAALADGASVLQANLDVSNPDASLLTTASALSYWSGNRMVQQARTALGWSADLGGTGMCLKGSALAAAGGFSAAFAEDRDLAIRVLLSGRRVEWLHTVRILDEKPASAGTAVRQRARWRNADRELRRRHLLPLLGHAVSQRSAAAADVALRMVRPGRAALVSCSTPLAALSLITRSRWLLPACAWTPTVAAQLLLPPLFLARDGVPLRYVLRYPAVICLSGLAIPVQVMAPRLRGRWEHTPHVG